MTSTASSPRSIGDAGGPGPVDCTEGQMQEFRKTISELDTVLAVGIAAWLRKRGKVCGSTSAPAEAAPLSGAALWLMHVHFFWQRLRGWRSAFTTVLLVQLQPQILHLLTKSKTQQASGIPSLRYTAQSSASQLTPQYLILCKSRVMFDTRPKHGKACSTTHNLQQQYAHTLHPRLHHATLTIRDALAYCMHAGAAAEADRGAEGAAFGMLRLDGCGWVRGNRC